MTLTTDDSAVHRRVTELMELLSNEIHARFEAPNIVRDDVSRAEGALIALRCLRDLAQVPIGLEQPAPCWTIRQVAPSGSPGPHRTPQLIGHCRNLLDDLNLLSRLTERNFVADEAWSDRLHGARIAAEGFEELVTSSLDQAAALLLGELDLEP